MNIAATLGNAVSEAANLYQNGILVNGGTDYRISLDIAADEPVVLSVALLGTDKKTLYAATTFAYDKAGDFDSAVNLVEKFIQKFPTDPTVEIAKDYLDRRAEEDAHRQREKARSSGFYLRLRKQNRRCGKNEQLEPGM